MVDDEFGGWTALAVATSTAAVGLLLSRGANVGSTYVPIQSEDGHLPSRSMLPDHLVLCASHDRDAVARSLVLHGANPSDAEYCCHEDGQGLMWEYKLENAPTCYWPMVVAGGDVEWAKILLEKCGTDPNWPQSENNIVENLSSPSDNGCHWKGLGATVLMIAILQKNLEMVRLLLANGADACLPEFVGFLSGEIHYRTDFLSEDQYTHYWGKSYDEIREDNENKIVAPRDKLATPLSVARGIGDDTIIALLRSHGAVEQEGATPAAVPVNIGCW